MVLDFQITNCSTTRNCTRRVHKLHDAIIKPWGLRKRSKGLPLGLGALSNTDLLPGSLLKATFWRKTADHADDAFHEGMLDEGA